MIIQKLLYEDKLPQKLPIMFSSNIWKKIRNIKAFNSNNADGILQWTKYIDGIADYVSNPAIAFDYANRYRRFRNGATYVRDFDYGVGFSLITNRYTNQLTVYIFKINLNTEAYGLLDPSKRKKASIKVSESKLRKIIRESVRQILRQVLNERTLLEHRSIGKRRPNRVRNF